MTKKENNILLFSITLCWAASYIFIKELPEDFSSYAYLTLTTGIAALIIGVVFCKKLKFLRKSIWSKGLFLSILLSMNLLAEKKGISLLPSSNASFLSALTIILVPLFLFFLHQKPKRNHLIGSAIILFGLCVSAGFQFLSFYSIGTLYMLAGCVCSAVYTIAVDRYAKEEDPILICLVQMIFTALIGYFLWILEDPHTFQNIKSTRELWSCIFILAFFTKAYAYIVLMFSQKYTDAVNVTVIASTEPIITLFLAVLLPGSFGQKEHLEVLSLVGAVLIAAGAIVAGIDFLSKSKVKTSRQIKDTNAEEEKLV